MKIALVGAESTGKTTLAAELADALRSSGRRVAVVPELLRGWCEQAGREPRPDEYVTLAHAQERAVDAAAADAQIVIADTTALVVATYSAIGAGDTALWSFALDRQRRYDHTLLTGLDLPWMADGLQRVGPVERQSVDGQLRKHLAHSGIAYRVLYGCGPERVAAALAAITSLDAEPNAAESASTGQSGAVRWRWLCDRCGDAACERRLLSR